MEIEQNFSQHDHLGLKFLLDLKKSGIIIKSADKSTAPVLISMEHYDQEIMSHLGSETYRILSPSAADTVVQETHDALHRIFRKPVFLREINDLSLLKYLKVGTNIEASRFPLFYGLIKVHKQRRPEGSPFPVRPVAGAHSYITGAT